MPRCRRLGSSRVGPSRRPRLRVRSCGARPCRRRPSSRRPIAHRRIARRPRLASRRRLRRRWSCSATVARARAAQPRGAGEPHRACAARRRRAHAAHHRAAGRRRTGGGAAERDAFAPRGRAVRRAQPLQGPAGLQADPDAQLRRRDLNASLADAPSARALEGESDPRRSTQGLRRGSLSCPAAPGPSSTWRIPLSHPTASVACVAVSSRITTVEARDLPWRRTRDPYAIWISEVMLQQTRVETVQGAVGRLPRALPRRAHARARPGGHGAQGVGGARLLPPCALPPARRAADRRRARRRAARRRGVACAHCPASAPTPLPRWRASRSGAASPSWTATSSACSRACSTRGATSRRPRDADPSRPRPMRSFREGGPATGTRP